MHSPFLFVASMALALPSPALSQDYGLGGIDAFMSSSQSHMMTMNTIIGNAAFGASLKNHLASRTAAKTTKAATLAKKASAPRQPQPQPQPMAPLSALSFKPSSAVSAKSKATFFATLRKADPEAARQIEPRFDNVSLHEKLSEALAGHGLRADNVADAMTVWLVNLWLGANGQSQDPSPTQIRAIRAQMADALRASPALTAAKDAQKQEMAEGLILHAAVIGAASADPRAKSGPGKVALQDVTTRIGNSMGMDFTAMRITDEGFVS